MVQSGIRPEAGSQNINIGQIEAQLLQNLPKPDHAYGPSQVHSGARPEAGSEKKINWQGG